MSGLVLADLVLRLIEILVPALVRESVELTALRNMVAEGREPTRDEWNAAFRGIEREGERLRAAVEALRARAGARE